MKILPQIHQGSQEWLAHRRTTRNASDAPAMMGASPYVSRAELVKRYATGIVPEVDAATQRVFDRGHEVEPALRALAESIISEELYPVTATSSDGYLGASFDGVSLDEDIFLEAKQPNAAKIAMIHRGELPPMDYWQVVQQFAVCESAQRCIYLVGDGGKDTTAVLWVHRDAIEGDIPKLIAGWKQFDADVAAYQHEQPAAPVATGRAPETLPALHVDVTGKVLASNLDSFREQAMAVLGSINRDLKTDDDFATAEATVKWCSDVEQRLGAAKANVLGQMADIDAVCRTLDDVAAETRRIRLDLDKLVKAEKEARKAEIVKAGIDEVRGYYTGINATLGEYAIGVPAAMASDIGGSIKGLRTLASIKDKVSAAVAHAKIDASQRADQVRACMAVMADAGNEALFPDRVQLCQTKAPDDLRNLVAARIAEHEAAIRKQAEEAAERERERIRLEEAAKAKAEAERVALAEAQRQHDEQLAMSLEAQRQDEPVFGAPEAFARTVTTRPGPGDERATYDTGARLKLGDINAAIAPLSITADGMSKLGFESVGHQKAAKLYRACEFDAIKAAMTRAIQSAAVLEDAA